MTDRWAYLLEHPNGPALLIPVKNFPGKPWTGHTAEFNVDPSTISESCWWEILGTTRRQHSLHYHYKFVYRKKWEMVNQKGQSLFSAEIRFFQDDYALRKYWREQGTTPVDWTILYQDWVAYNNTEIERQRNL